MTTTDNRPVDTGLIAEHSILVPFGLGFLSGISAGGFLVGGVLLGYPVGRSRTGAPGVIAGSIGSILGSTIIFIWLVVSLVNSGCPSCIDAVIFGWMVPFFYAVPFWIGCAIGSWRRSRALARARSA